MANSRIKISEEYARGRENFAKALEEYVQKRENEREYTHTVFFCIPVGCSKTDKISAAKKMINELRDVSGCKYNIDELEALRQGRLGKIVSKFSRFEPNCFRGDETEAAEWEIRRQELRSMHGFGYGNGYW